MINLNKPAHTSEFVAPQKIGQSAPDAAPPLLYQAYARQQSGGMSQIILEHWAKIPDVYHRLTIGAVAIVLGVLAGLGSSWLSSGLERLF